MFGSWSAIGVGCCAVLVALIGCGGSVEHSGSGDESSVGGGGQVGTPSQHKAGSTGTATAGTTSVAGQASAGTASGGFPNLPDDPPPVTSGCAMEGQAPVSNECDPFGVSSCLAGMACYPYVDHPEGNGCGTQTYGTVCLPNGIGTQGMRCGDDTGDWCAPGHVCVVGQRAGKRCAKLCQLGSVDQCEGGLVCGDLDVAGYGVCG